MTDDTKAAKAPKAPAGQPNRQDNTPPLDDRTAKGRERELKRQQGVVDAVYAATHDKAGNPIPLGGADEDR